MPSWQFELLSWVICSRFPLVSHFDLPGSQSTFSVPQDCPCVHTYLLAKMESITKACGQGTTLDISPFGLRGAFSALVWSGKSPDFEKKICGLGRAQPSQLIVLLFSSWSFSQQGVNLPLLYPVRGRGEHLPPALAPVGEQLPKIFRIIVICL